VGLFNFSNDNFIYALGRYRVKNKIISEIPGNEIMNKYYNSLAIVVSKTPHTYIVYPPRTIVEVLLRCSPESARNILFNEVIQQGPIKVLEYIIEMNKKNPKVTNALFDKFDAIDKETAHLKNRIDTYIDELSKRIGRSPFSIIAFPTMLGVRVLLKLTPEGARQYLEDNIKEFEKNQAILYIRQLYKEKNNFVYAMFDCSKAEDKVLALKLKVEELLKKKNP